MSFSKLLIIRHGEKPGDPAVDTPDDGVNLSTKGYERAGALAAYIPRNFGRPDFLYATRTSQHSNRPIETVTPLSTGTGLEIHSEYGDNEYDKLAQKLKADDKFNGKQILICWHHGKIPELVSALGYAPPLSRWPANSFDRVWVVDNTHAMDGHPSLVQNLPQRLMFGDGPE